MLMADVPLLIAVVFLRPDFGVKIQPCCLALPPPLAEERWPTLSLRGFSGSALGDFTMYSLPSATSAS